MRCAVSRCRTNNEGKNNESKYSFFSIPKNEKLSKKWIAFCDRNDDFRTKNARICEKHFKPSDFVPKTYEHEDPWFSLPKHLKPGTIPSLRIEERARKAAQPKVEDTPFTNASDQKNLLKYSDICNDSTASIEASYLENLHANNRQKTASNNGSDTEEKISVLQIIEENDEHENEDEDEFPTAKRRKLNGQAQETYLDEALQCMKNYMNRNKKRDEHSIFGEFVAHKIRACNRSNTDIAIAHHHIENVIFNLTMGVYNKVRPPPSTNRCDLTIPATSTNVESSTKGANYNLIIPKPEPE